VYYPDYIAGLVFLLGGILASIAYFIRIRKVKRKFKVSFIELYDDKYSNEIKAGLKGLTVIQISLVLGALVLAIIIAIINKQ
jgi:hypothetical protein